MKFLFVVQGEGRGHLTQAIALKEMLTKNGHQIVNVLVGKSKRRELPSFFSNSMNTPICRFESPNFLPSPKNKKNNIWISLAYNIFRTILYLRSIHFIRTQIKKSEADVVVNFYEFLTGLSYACFPPKIPYISIAHQYLFLHPEYKFPPCSIAELKMLKIYTRISCCRASKLFALSITKKEDVPFCCLTVMPPLLRKEFFTIKAETGNYLHGYMLNDTYIEDIINFQKNHPETTMHFFWDKKDAPEEMAINEHLTLHRLNDQKFIKYMAGCKAYATTAGFESVCEAIYLGKPVLMVPTHIEQDCNAYEISLAGGGIVDNAFNLDILLHYIPEYKENNEFRAWIQESEFIWMKAFELKKEDLIQNRLGYKFLLTGKQ
ncbi:MAG: glycosyltransferase [Dysgonamonadaceae bacterium]|jgi:uncharacterized protein (TIGR00661 family)|nr:glycosyltransferase [Dysgonamonadaceae bacterium]